MVVVGTKSLNQQTALHLYSFNLTSPISFAFLLIDTFTQQITDYLGIVLITRKLDPLVS